MNPNSSAAVVHTASDPQKPKIRSAQVHMLYSNVNVGVVVTVAAATILCPVFEVNTIGLAATSQSCTSFLTNC